MADDLYDPDDDYGPPRLPGVVRAAGIIWIVTGSLALLAAALNILARLLQAGVAANNAQAGIAATSGVCGAVIAGLVGTAFLVCGIQTVKGTAKDTLGNGIGSILLGALALGIGVLGLIGLGAVGAGAVGLIVFGIYGTVGGGLITAGILALSGRQAYLVWRRYARPGRRRRDDRDEPDDDFDDRPRRRRRRDDEYDDREDGRVRG